MNFRILLYCLIIFSLAACQSGAALPVGATEARIVSQKLTPEVVSPLVTASQTSTPTQLVVKKLQATTATITSTSTVSPALSIESTADASFREKVTLCPIEEDFCVIDGHFLFERPIGSEANQSADQTYRYGTTQGGRREPHHGVEFPNKQGTPVLAAADGVVIFAGNDKDVFLSWVPAYYGNVVVIRHDSLLPAGEIFTLYAHLFDIKTSVGQHVKAGEVIGSVGATGTAIGSHLHFEVRIGKNDYQSSRNPELWLKPRQGNGVIAGWIRDQQGNPIQGSINVQRIKDGVLDTNPVTLIEPYFLKEKQPVNSDDTWDEMLAAGELPAGTYRLTINLLGKLREKIVQVEPGKLTFVRFVSQ